MVNIVLREGEYTLVNSEGRSLQACRRQLFDDTLQEIPQEDLRFQVAYHDSLLRKPMASAVVDHPVYGTVKLLVWRFAAPEIDSKVRRQKELEPEACLRQLAMKVLGWSLAFAVAAGFVHYRQVTVFGGW